MEKSAVPDIIDVHCHCFAGPAQAAQVSAGLAELRRAGVRHLAVMGLINTTLDRQAIGRLIPEGFENLGDPLFFEVDDLLGFSRDSGSMLLPMIDTRCLAGEVESLLQGYLDRGFHGIKGLYMADDGNDLRIATIPDVFNLTLQQYHEREWRIFAFAEANDLPVLYHMDAGRHGDVMRAILEDFPHLRINFPHFGIGRRAFSAILDRYPNAYTDIAYMRPHIQEKPDGYRDFICHYPERVCFGSDALLYQPEIVLHYIDLVRSLGLPDDVEASLLYGNPRRYLGLAPGS